MTKTALTKLKVQELRDHLRDLQQPVEVSPCRATTSCCHVLVSP